MVLSFGLTWESSWIDCLSTRLDWMGYLKYWSHVLGLVTKATGGEDIKYIAYNGPRRREKLLSSWGGGVVSDLRTQYWLRYDRSLQAVRCDSLNSIFHPFFRVRNFNNLEHVLYIHVTTFCIFFRFLLLRVRELS